MIWGGHRRQYSAGVEGRGTYTVDDDGESSRGIEAA